MRAFHNFINMMCNWIKERRELVSSQVFLIINMAMLKQSGSRIKLCNNDGAPKVFFWVQRAVADGKWNVPCILFVHADCVVVITLSCNVTENFESFCDGTKQSFKCTGIAGVTTVSLSIFVGSVIRNCFL